MAIESNKLPLGTKAPDFALPDTVSGDELSLSALKGEKATVVMFICNHCPYVKHVNIGMIKLAHDYDGKGVSFIAISANDAERYPEDAPEKMKEVADMLDYPFPYLYDESQEVAKAYDAACTPDFYVFDKDLKLAYHGQLDESRPKSNIPVTGDDIRQALNLLLIGEAPPKDQKPSIGCGIKWKEQA